MLLHWNGNSVHLSVALGFSETVVIKIEYSSFWVIFFDRQILFLTRIVLFPACSIVSILPFNVTPRTFSLRWEVPLKCHAGLIFPWKKVAHLRPEPVAPAAETRVFCLAVLSLTLRPVWQPGRNSVSLCTKQRPRKKSLFSLAAFPVLEHFPIFSIFPPSSAITPDLGSLPHPLYSLRIP